MAAPKPERSKLSPEESREMQKLTGELKELLNKIAKIVGSETGAKAPFNTVTVIVQSGDNPLQIGFGNSRILNVENGATPINAREDEEIGYYIDPPGVCTTVPACIPY